MKLGKLAPKDHAKTLQLSKYLPATLPAPPRKVWREYKVPTDKWGMFKNDTVGDCTCAAIAHMLMLMTAHTGEMVVPTDADVLKAYSAITGYNAQTGLNDNGAAITDVLEYWRTTGLCGHKILGWAQINHSNIAEVKQAIYLFGGIDIGVQLPANAQQQFSDGKSWHAEYYDGGIEGGHSIVNFGYGEDGTNCITWAERQPMNWAWFQKYCDEAYAVITEDWINKVSGLAPNSVNLATLAADLKNLSV